MPYKISLMPFGIVIERRGRVALSFNEEAVAALAGPLVNIVLAVILVFLYKYNHNELILFSIAVNCGLGALNLLPIEPLDGSRVLHALLSRKLSESRSEQITRAVSFAFLLPLAACGFYILIKSGYNITLLIVVIYASVLLMFKKNK
ncbi:MAG TPA: site-2 protease family protein [Clostridia bacterium]|nr:site-2 protease family protein [Clostridia bacterium]